MHDDNTTLAPSDEHAFLLRLADLENRIQRLHRRLGHARAALARQEINGQLLTGVGEQPSLHAAQVADHKHR